MMPEQEDHSDPDLSPESAGTIRKVADVVGVIAGILFLIAFGINLAQNGAVNVWFLGAGILFLLFPLFVHRFVRSGR